MEHVCGIFCALGAFPNHLIVHLLRWPPSGLNHFAIFFWAQVSRPEHFRNRNEIKLVDGTRPNNFRAFFEHCLIMFGAFFEHFLCLRVFKQNRPNLSRWRPQLPNESCSEVAPWGLVALRACVFFLAGAHPRIDPQCLVGSQARIGSRINAGGKLWL